jgi:hypothetical protein
VFTASVEGGENTAKKTAKMQRHKKYKQYRKEKI